MEETNSILKEIRKFLVGSEDNKDFDQELIPHINSALATLNQAGVGKMIFVKGDTETWSDFKDPLQIKGNELFQMVPLYVSLKTQLLFDPPPPSNVEYHANSSKELLWRLKIAYEQGSEVNGT